MKLSLTFCVLSLFICLMVACSDDESEMMTDNCEGVSVSYSSDILPVVNASCAVAGCHVAGFPSGDFTAYAGLKAKADNGSLMREVVNNKTMPQSGTISQAQRDLFECWIADGAPDN
ncbi:MAG: hypothetical protein KJO50_03715 [Bacteroidia bacterium]|nr:hypothetical protein [Bacteroidia bacterium]